MLSRIVVFPVLCACLVLSIAILVAGLWAGAAYGEGCSPSPPQPPPLGYSNAACSRPECEGTCGAVQGGYFNGPTCTLIWGCSCKK